MSRITASEKMDVLEANDLPRWLTIILREIKGVLNNGILFQDNFNAQIISVAFDTADTEVSVSLRLNRIPTGYVFLGGDKMIVYDGDTAFANNRVYLKASAVGTARLLVY